MRLKKTEHSDETAPGSKGFAADLTQLGYQVDLRRNLGINEFDKAVADHVERLSANPASEGFFWYAGHGIQIGDSGNYLIPVDFPQIEDRPENRIRITRAVSVLLFLPPSCPAAVSLALAAAPAERHPASFAPF